MSEIKTQPTAMAPADFIASVEHQKRQADALVLLEMFNRITGLEAVMWGPSIIGYGTYTYSLANGKSGTFMRTGFSPRKAAMTVYIMPGFKQYEEQLSRLGKHKHSVSCLYINRLDKIDMSALQEIVADSVRRMKEIYPQWKP